CPGRKDSCGPSPRPFPAHMPPGAALGARSVHFGLLAQFIPHTGLPSGLTRGPLSTCRKPGFRGSQVGPRVEPEGSKVLVWATKINPGRSKGEGATAAAAVKT